MYIYIGFGNRILLFFSFLHMKKKKKLLQASIDGIAAIAMLSARLRYNVWYLIYVHASVRFITYLLLCLRADLCILYCRYDKGDMYLLPVTCTL